MLHSFALDFAGGVDGSEKVLFSFKTRRLHSLLGYELRVLSESPQIKSILSPLLRF